MKTLFLCFVLLLAGTASSSHVQINRQLDLVSDIKIPDWIHNLIDNYPESIKNIIDRLPMIIEAVPSIVETIKDRLPEIIELINDTAPKVIEVILDRLPEIITAIAELIDQLHPIVEAMNKEIQPKYNPLILEKIHEIIAATPDALDKIRVVLKQLDLPVMLLANPEIPEMRINSPIQGTPADISEFPSIVQIEVGGRLIWIQRCTGSVITIYHVLTTARCIHRAQLIGRFRVRAGSSIRSNGGTITSVSIVIAHPSFDPISFDGDVAVIRLEQGLVLSDTIQQTAIVPAGYTVAAGSPTVLASWGSTAQGGLISNRRLFQINLTVSDRSECAVRWDRIPTGRSGVLTVTDNMFCISRPETGGRNGDVRDLGAPVYITNVLAGLVSFSAPIGNQYFPVVATNVASYTPWIVDNAV